MAIETQLKDLVAVDPKTGDADHYGAICKKRMIGKTTTWLTYAEHDQLWWIVLRDPQLGVAKIGFIEARRETCWEVFEALDEKAIEATFARKGS